MYEFGQLVYLATNNGASTGCDISIFYGRVIHAQSFHRGRDGMSIEYKIGSIETTETGEVRTVSKTFYEDNFGHGDTREKALRSLANQWFDYAQHQTDIANEILELITKDDEPPSEL